MLNTFKQYWILCLSIFLLNLPCYAYKEKDYQEVWCNADNGIMEYRNEDNTRVDCLTNEYSVEFDFANKWAESIGQALHYGLMTGKRPKVVLIIEKENQYKYLNRVIKLSQMYDFDVEYITPKELKWK